MQYANFQGYDLARPGSDQTVITHLSTKGPLSSHDYEEMVAPTLIRDAALSALEAAGFEVNRKGTREAMAEAWREGRDWAVRKVEQQIMDGYPKRLPLGEKCPHGVLNGHDCIGCYDEALMTRLAAIRQNGPTPTILDAALAGSPQEGGSGGAELPPSPSDDVKGTIDGR